MSYDQWKTATPYDNEPDWSEYGAKCPKCGSKHFEVFGSCNECMELDMECSDCGTKFIFNIPKEFQQQEYDYGYEDFCDGKNDPLMDDLYRQNAFGVERTYDDKPIFTDETPFLEEDY